MVLVAVLRPVEVREEPLEQRFAGVVGPADDVAGLLRVHRQHCMAGRRVVDDGRGGVARVRSGRSGVTANVGEPGADVVAAVHGVDHLDDLEVGELGPESGIERREGPDAADEAGRRHPGGQLDGVQRQAEHRRACEHVVAVVQELALGVEAGFHVRDP